MPTATDLVTDLPADFEVFGQAVDTRLKALNPETTLGDISYASSTANTNTRLGIGSNGQVLTVAAGVPSWASPSDQTPLTTKGDLFTYTTTDARLAVGANDTVLIADSSTATGLKWGAPASGGRTLINTGGTSMNGVSTITISSIPSTYQSLYIVIDDFNGAGGGDLQMRPNNNTGGNYVYDNRYWSAAASGSASLQITETSYLLAVNVSATNSVSAASITIDNYASTTAAKPISARGVNLNQTTSGNAGFTTNGGWFNATAISSLTFLNSAGFNWSTGTIYVYGVK